MAQGTKSPATAAAAPPAPAPVGVNRKKQKRREKLAAKQAAEAQKQSPAPAKNGVGQHGHSNAAPPQPPGGQSAPHYADAEHDDPANDEYEEDEEEGDFYSDDDDHYDHAYGTNGHPPGGYPGAPMGNSGASKKSRKKKRGSSAAQQPPYQHSYAARPAPGASIPDSKSTRKKGGIWNNDMVEERERIREFWLSLGEEDRKSLVKIEKEAVLRKMKEQQKHSCSCTVCGRKRTAIEEELEVLYDAYYEELEQYANHQQDVGPILPPVHYAHRHSMPHHRRLVTRHPPPEPYDEADDLSQGDEEDDGDEGYSNSEISSEDDYSSEGRPGLRPPDADFLQFGSSLQVKGGILTVADDLLKNDGKKFIEMMEQLAERRMQREEEAQYNSHPSMYGRSHAPHNHGPPPDDDEFDDEDNDDDAYSDNEYDEDDEDEDDTMTEEQRMEEGRRMFQIFAARMFEQRVLQAYREKVAAERQQRLLEELAEEDDKKEQREAKKAKEAQKRKEKKEKQKQARAEAQARKEAEQQAKEAEARKAEEKRLEEQRKKKEEQRKKREAERRAQEEEKQRKEAEKLKRQQEERERQQEAERRQRELRAAKDEAKRKEREEREAREKEAREKKAQEEKERREREAKAKAEKERLKKEEQAAASTAKKNTQPVAPALPPNLLKQNSSTGVPSPHVTPALPKAPTPNRPRQSSQQGSHGSSPKTPNILPGPSKSISPTSQAQSSVVPKSILTKSLASQQQQTPMHQAVPGSPMPPFGPPPGMQAPPGMAMNMPPGLGSLPHPYTPILAPGMPDARRSFSYNTGPFPHQPPSHGYSGLPPPGVQAPSPMSIQRGFPLNGPPGFSSAPPMPPYMGPIGIPSHSRGASGSFDRSGVESPIGAATSQPIQRPTPIQRPSSVKPHEENKPGHLSDVDEVASHLGSKALLDDVEDDVPPPEQRRTSMQQPGSMRGAPLGFEFGEAPGHPRADSYPFGSASNAGSIWNSTPPMPFSMGGATGWGNSPTASVFHNPFTIKSTVPRRPGENRLIWIRRMVCAICKQLGLTSQTNDGSVEGRVLHNSIETMRPSNEAPISIEEIKESCDIFGDTVNGGGSLTYNENPQTGTLRIRFLENSGTPAGLGEIGSPVPGHSVPFGGSRAFPGLGPQGF